MYISLLSPIIFHRSTTSIIHLFPSTSCIRMRQARIDGFMFFFFRLFFLHYDFYHFIYYFFKSHLITTQGTFRIVGFPPSILNTFIRFLTWRQRKKNHTLQYLQGRGRKLGCEGRSLKNQKGKIYRPSVKMNKWFLSSPAVELLRIWFCQKIT